MGPCRSVRNDGVRSEGADGDPLAGHHTDLPAGSPTSGLLEPAGGRPPVGRQVTGGRGAQGRTGRRGAAVPRSGALEVLRDGVPVPLAGARLTAALSLLLLNVGGHVATTALEEAMWAGSPAPGLRQPSSRTCSGCAGASSRTASAGHPRRSCGARRAGTASSPHRTRWIRCATREEALRTYQQARTLLRDELGLEPGPGLRETHAGILADDPPPTTAAEPVHDATPHSGQLPVGSTDRLLPIAALCGTEFDIAVVQSAVTAAPPLLTSDEVFTALAGWTAGSVVSRCREA